MKIGRNLVKISDIHKGVSECKGSDFFLITYRNSVSYLKQRIYRDPKSSKFISKLFEAVGKVYRPNDHLDSQFNGLVGEYLIINVISNIGPNNKFLDVDRFLHVSEEYQCFVEEPDTCWTEESEDYQFYYYDENVNLARTPFKRKYFETIDTGESYLVKRYHEMCQDLNYPSKENVLLFSASSGVRRLKILAPATWSYLEYFNALAPKNETLKETCVVEYCYDQIGRIVESVRHTFSTEEGAMNYIKSFYDEGDKYGKEEAKIINDVKKYNEGVSGWNNRQIQAYEDSIWRSSPNQDFLDFGLEGDPDNMWNID